MTFVLKDQTGIRRLVLGCLSQRPNFSGRSVRVEFVVHQVVMEPIFLKVFLLFSANILLRVHSTNFYLHAAFFRSTERRDLGTSCKTMLLWEAWTCRKKFIFNFWWSFEKLSISLLKYDKQKCQIKQIGLARGITPLSVAIKEVHLGLLSYPAVELSKLVPTFRSKLLPPLTGKRKWSHKRRRNIS